MVVHFTKCTAAVPQKRIGFSCVCPVIDHEFCHNIVKVAVDPRGDSLPRFWRHLGWGGGGGANTAKFTVNVREFGRL